MIPYNQLSLADILSNCQEICESDKPQFLSFLQQHIDLDEIVPDSFQKHFYVSTGRTRKYPLNAFKELFSGDTYGSCGDFGNVFNCLNFKNSGERL